MTRVAVKLNVSLPPQRHDAIVANSHIEDMFT
jgi:hypothetical protein